MSTPGTSQPDPARTEVLHIAVGIPGGVVVDTADRGSGRRTVGAVRLGNGVVFLPDQDYVQWSLLLRPQPATPEHGDIDTRLAEQGLVAVLGSWAAARQVLMPLRPLMTGFALGNMDGEPDRFLYRPTASDAQVIALNPVENLIAWQFNGSATLGEVVAAVAARLPDISPDAIESIAVRLVLRLMAHQSLLLDARPAAGAG